jgi:hypothetical protein
VLYKCPCGDHPAKIPEYRQRQTYMDGAFWCSTVMAMLNFDGSVKYVWNPFSLHQLKEMLVDLDAYLECVASKNDASCTSMTPRNDVFERQQISLLSVYQRCLTNYQEMTWDQGTYVLFNGTLQGLLLLDMPLEIRDTFGVAKCLLEQRANGYDNVGCMRDYFLKGTQPMDYFEYGNITIANPPSKMVDACLTFSGPAELPNPAAAAPFQACLESYANRSGCDIPHMLWSGRSTNKVPVATQHAMKITDDGERERWARNMMAAEKDSVSKAIQSLAGWNGTNIRISVFSAEGDIMHQYADCVMMGPMPSATLTPGPDSVEKVVWARGGGGRLFDLPCSGAKLANRNGIRDTQAPYTCGTFPRRAVIKYYLRERFGGMRDSANARDMVVNAVKQMINQTRDAWTDDLNYQCTCANGTTTGWGCCEEQSKCSVDPCACPAGFEVPASVACCKDVCGGLAGNGLMGAFSYINGSDLAVELLEGMGTYLRNEIWTSNEPWLKYDPLGEQAFRESWEASKFAVIDAGLFDASSPVVTYEEFNYPFKSTMWKHCAGLMQQVMWTMPVDSASKRPRMPSTEYNPMAKTSNTINITYTEEFIQSITLQAYKSSPLYWHYGARYAPSASEVCKRATPNAPGNGSSFSVGKRTAARFGYSSMTLGGLGGADCYCGWWEPSGGCRIPETLCEALVQIVGFLRVCLDQQRHYNSTDHSAVLRAIETLTARQPVTTYSCPSLQISEHWGFMDADGLPLANATGVILTEGVAGFRKGNTEWLFDTQSSIINPKTRISQAERGASHVALECDKRLDSSIADHFVEDLFPVAQGVRQSMPQTYCTRYGVELARLTVYREARLAAAIGQQEGVVDKWRERCQYKLEELAVCNLHKVTAAYNASHRSTSHCPFTLQVDGTVLNSYSVTPGCLLIVWNTPKSDGIYDPCTCLALRPNSGRTCAGNLNINTGILTPATFLVPDDLLTSCMMRGLQDLVGESVVPGETAAKVPIGSGSFASLMDKSSLKINTQERSHWAIHKEIWDADFIQDWWPDEWRFPAGYHVTPGCSRPNDSSWKTFDSSWRWDATLNRMVLATDATNDALLRRNAFGASGACRTSNYGMPMTGLNTMAACTKENADAKADPMVPPPAQQTAWVDGQEFCAPDSFSTPWDVDRQSNPPRQWTVGTLQQESGGLLPLDFADWGSACGPYPLQTCRSNQECAADLQCLKSMGVSVGVCANTKSEVFDCAEHSHCTGDTMCAGDGKCVAGVWKVSNTLGQDISFRTHSQQCPTGNPASTWGTSVAELVPDILKSSGLCSFRAWYENRKMASENQCTQGSCAGVKGALPWNFTDHRSSNSAFDDGVLKVNAHACDREYQFYEGFVACTPKDEFMELFRNDAAQPKPAPRDTRTRTYRTDRTLPLVSLTNGALTKGFTGIPKTYNELNLGRDTTMVRPCSQVNVCGLQSDFMVNGKRVTRQVLDAGVAREYAVTDMINCGSFGYMGTGSSVCQLDFAVVPLAYFFARYAGSLKSQSATAPFVNLKRSTSYNPGAMNIAAYFLELKQLPDLLIREYVGALPETLAAYMDGVDRFVDLHAKLSEPPKPIYEEAGSPKQIYYVTKMGVYEVPFAWWYRCIWLTGYSMDVYEIGNEACPALAGTPSSPSWPDVVFHPHSNRLLGLLNVPPSAAMPTKPVKLVDALKQLPGVISKRVFGKVAAEFKTNRDSWLKKLDPMVANTIKKCYSKKVYLREFSSQSQEYQLDQINQYMTGRGFDLIKSYVGTQNQTVCENEGCVKSADPVISSLSTPGQFGARVIAKLMDAQVDVKGTALLSGPADTSETGYVFISGLATSAEIPESFWAALGSAYQNVPDGCATRISAGNSYKESVGCACSDWGECSAMLKSEILLKSGIPHQPVDAFSTVVMEGMGIVNVCDPDFPRAETCFPTAHTLIPGSNYSQLSKVNLPIGVSLETFQQSSWDCARFSCTDTSNSYHNSVKSIDISFMPTTTHEMVVMNEVSFVQKTFSQKTRPWSSMSEQGSELLLYDQRPGLGPDEVYCMPSSDGGDPDRSMPFREVAEGPEFRLKVYTYHYYVNGVKAAVLETHPCVEDIPLAGDPTKKQSDHWPVLVSTMGKFNGYRPPYGSAGICNTKGIGGLVPSADALFATATPRNFTTYSPAGSSMSSMQQVASRIQNVLSVIQSQLAQGDSECLQNSQCEVRQDDLQASARITNTYASNDPQMQDFCSSMKSDPLYGCIMYPGEAVTQEKRCGRYSALKKAACSIPNSPIPGTGKDWWPCTWSQFYRCLNDASDDKCYDGFSSSDGGEITKQFRSMKPTGKRVVFDLKTTTRQCTHGPVMRCKLSDEINSVQPTDRPGLCPNAEDGTLQRTRLYNRLKLQRSPPTIVTDITKSVSLSGESSATATTTFATGEVDHVLLAMNPGYTCSLSTPACPASEMPVQMRRHLWRCARCPMVSETFCIGQHNCLMETPGIPRDSLNTLDGWDNLTIQERAFLTTSNATTDVAISAVRWLVGQVMQLAMTGVGMGYDIPDFMRTYGGSDFTYSPLSVIAFSNAMESRAQTCTSVGVIPVFTNCSYDTNRRSLRDFVGARYKLQDGVVISNQSTMVWNVIRAQMTSQNIPTWLATGGKAGMFWENLFDDKWCKRGNMEDSACYITNGGTKTVVEVLNPGLLGDFEPMMGCDTKVVNGQRVVNAMCPACAAQEQDLLLTEGTPMPCQQYYQTVTGVTSNLEADSNLCGKAPAFDSTCENPQGMLGQTAFDGNPIRSVYSRVPWRGGLPPGIRENPLFRGAAPGETVSNLMLKPTDIGGHCLSLEIRNARTGPTMSIVELPLSSYSDIKSAYAVRDGTGLKWMQINAPAEIDAMRTLYPNSACGTWDCPLRRRAFYSGKKAVNGKSSQFRPLVPDPLRAQVLFGSPVHPTQRAVPLPETVAGTVRTLGVFYTSNGFCACMAPPCSLCKSDEDALSGVWQTATAGASACSNQMDWPFPGGALRDKSTYRGNLGSVTCGILDRLPPFKYRYVNTKRTTPSAKTTLDQGGVCHMGWPVSAAIPSGCYLLPDTDKYVCQRGIPSPVNRLRAKTVDELLQPRQRPRLAECEPPPAYVTGDGKEVRPEVSYGVMKRLETSRLLAIDLRRKLCGNNSVCAPSAEWELSSFWSEVYMKDFPGTPGGDGANQTLWDQPWAACKQHPENQTQTCEGTIKRADWVQGNRTDLCLSTIRTTSIANDLAQPINICDLDQDMDAFCRSIQDARYRVFEANCLYSGQCRQKLFFYQPSTYSVDNAQFVRSTVQQFYDSTVAGACVPDLDTAAAILANAENIKNCAALTLTTLADCIQVVRVIMDSLVEIVFYVGNLFLYVFEMLVAGSNDDLRVQIIQRINAILQHIKNSFLQLFNAFGDLIYKVLFDGPMGQWVMTVIVKICEFLNWFYMNVVQPLICWVREAVLYVLDPIGTGFVRVINAIAFNQLGYLNTNIADAKKAVRQSMTCNNKSPLNCNISFRSKAAPRTTMPLATRCWAGAEPGVNSFACTAADTCLNNDFSKVVCGACPAASSMIKFGCNTMTKLCSCNIFVQDTSFCSSHEECTMDDSNVQCEFVDSYLQPSYGHTPCRQCPKPVCLISDGTGVGRCTCLLRPIPNQGCVGLGEQVSPSAASLCLVATAGGGQGASSTYTHTYRTLASAPCMLLNQATSYCMQVYTSATASAPMVVGLALLKTSSGRRLLQTTEQLRFNASEWGGEGEPCRALVAANESDLGILERYTLGECWRWRDIGTHLVADANMSAVVKPTFLVSWRDLLDTMLSEGALPEILSKLPHVIHQILLHTEAAQPVYVTLLYWTSFLPQEVWFNQTVLDQTRQFLVNYSESPGGRHLLASETKKFAGVHQWDQGPYGWMPHQIYWNLPGKRHLLQAEPTAAAAPSAEMANVWTQGPYTWPPNFHYWKGEQSCAVVSTAMNVVKNGLDVTMKFYQDAAPGPKKVTWPGLPFNDDPHLQFQAPASADVGEAIRAYADQVLNKTYVEEFLDNAPYAAGIRSLIQCNFTRIQTCHDRYDLLGSVAQVIVVMLAVGFVGKLLEIPYVEVLLFVFFVPLVMYSAYGYALTCAPLVPVCALRDLIAILDYFIPESVVWPDALVQTPGCTEVSCMKSCVDGQHIGFLSWNDHAAWALCELLDSKACLRIASRLAADSPLKKAIAYKLDPGDDPASTRAARWICFAVTLANSAPALLTLLLVLWVLPSALGVLVSILQFSANMLFTFVLFVHDGHED